jgi:uncharacterized protein YukE
MDGFEVEINALKSDAKVWDKAASDMDGPIQAIRPLTLNGADDVTGLGQRMGIDTSYEKARSNMETQMTQAVEYFHSLSSALTDVATNYEQMEASGASNMQSQENSLPGGN